MVRLDGVTVEVIATAISTLGVIWYKIGKLEAKQKEHCEVLRHIHENTQRLEYRIRRLENILLDYVNHNRNHNTKK